MQSASLAQQELATGQGSLFGDLMGETSDPAEGPLTPSLPAIPEFTESERLTQEKEILGFYISGHPLEPFRAECELLATHTVGQLGSWSEEPIAIGCVVTAVKRQLSKRSGNEFARLTVEDFAGSAEILVFPEAWAAIGDRVQTDIPVLIKGGYSRRDQDAENPTFIVESFTRLAELRANGQFAVTPRARHRVGTHRRRHARRARRGRRPSRRGGPGATLEGSGRESGATALGLAQAVDRRPGPGGTARAPGTGTRATRAWRLTDGDIRTGVREADRRTRETDR